MYGEHPPTKKRALETSSGWPIVETPRVPGSWNQAGGRHTAPHGIADRTPANHGLEGLQMMQRGLEKYQSELDREIIRRMKAEEELTECRRRWDGQMAEWQEDRKARMEMKKHIRKLDSEMEKKAKEMAASKKQSKQARQQANKNLRLRHASEMEKLEKKLKKEYEEKLMALEIRGIVSELVEETAQKEKLEKAEAEIQRLTKEKDEAERWIDFVESQLLNVNSGVVAHHKKQEEAANLKLKASEEKLKAAESDVTRLNGEVDDLKGKLKAAEEGKKKAAQNAEDLKRKMNKAEADLHAAETRISQLIGEKRQLAGTVSEIDDLKRLLKEKKEKIEALDTDLRRTGDCLQDANLKRTRTESQNIWLKDRVIQLQNDVKKLEKNSRDAAMTSAI